ncbi:MAG: 3-isopropylmalate dehydratase large subunit [Phycisphaerae bacterium]
MTITEKILATAAGKDKVVPGENIWVKVDVLMTHDVCGPGTIGIFHKEFGRNAKVFDPSKVVIIPDHYIFTADEKAHRNVEILRSFVSEQGIKHFYDADFVTGPGIPNGYDKCGNKHYSGVCHSTLAEKGHCVPGQLMIGTDSHTCTGGAFGMFSTGVGNTEAAFVLGTGKLWLKVPPTLLFEFEGTMPDYLMAKDLILTAIGDIGADGATYCAMEFTGQTITNLNMEERMTICNMAIEAGGKNGIISADQKTVDYVVQRGVDKKDCRMVQSDPDAKYISKIKYHVKNLEPTVACPHSPGNKATANKLKDQKIDRAYIGSCTGGKITDFRAAARILNNRKVKVDTFIVPATVEVDRALDSEQVGQKSLRQIFSDAGCRIGPPSCAACLGGPVDTFGRMNDPMICISTTNRNFPGRMGHPDSQVFLASPLTVAASSLSGRITDPRDV